MSMLGIISWRNVWRNPRRSWVMIMAIAIGLWGGLMALAIASGLMTERQKATIEQHISHVQIHHPDFLNEDNIRHHIGDPETLIRALALDERVKACSGRTILSGMLASASLTTGVRIIGIEADHEQATTGLCARIMEGDCLSDESPNQVLLGRSLADKIKARERSRLVLTFQDQHNEIISAAFRVQGIYQSSNSTLDDVNVYVRKQDLLTYLGDSVLLTELALVLFDIEQASSLADSLSVLFPELSVRTWTQVAPEMSYLNEMFGVMITIILGIILLALAFGLVNTMLMSVYERIQELGVLMAVGMNKRRIFTMIMLETTFITMIGAVLGVLLGKLSVQALYQTGLDLSVVGGDSLNYMGFSPVIYPYLESSFFGTLTIMVVITAFASAVFPSLKALRLHPAEAVRHE